MKPILTAEQSRNCDKYAVEKLSVKIVDLATQAANALYEAVMRHEPHNRVIVLCGRGNNGMDGLLLAEKLSDCGIHVKVISPYDKEDIFHNGVSFFDTLDNATSETAEPFIKKCDIVVDCLFGTGFNGAFDEKNKSLLALSEGRYIIAADMPSGVNCDTGAVAEGTVAANETVVFATYKPYCFLYPAKNYAGKITLADIGMPKEAIREQIPYMFATDDNILALVAPKDENSHKGTYGKVRLICGSRMKPGAAVLAVNGALHTGVGLVSLAAPASVRKVAQTYAPEPIYENRFSRTKASAIVIGCGLGTIAPLAVRFAFMQNVPLVLDADALTYLSKHIEMIEENEMRHVLTPHPLEMARLTGLTVEEVEKDRIGVARRFAMEYKVILVLKGHHTVIALPNGNVYINTSGNAGLAKGGSGDVLAGMIGGLIARGYKPETAAIIGVYAHGKAADEIVSNSSTSGVLPSDIPSVAAKYLK